MWAAFILRACRTPPASYATWTRADHQAPRWRLRECQRPPRPSSKAPSKIDQSIDVLDLTGIAHVPPVRTLRQFVTQVRHGDVRTTTTNSGLPDPEGSIGVSFFSKLVSGWTNARKPPSVTSTEHTGLDLKYLKEVWMVARIRINLAEIAGWPLRRASWQDFWRAGRSAAVSTVAAFVQLFGLTATCSQMPPASSLW